MFHQPSPVQMPQILPPTDLAADVPTLPMPTAPVADADDATPDYFAYKHYSSYAALYAPSPDAPGPLRLRASPDLSALADAPTACISTQQVFDLAADEACATPGPVVPSDAFAQLEPSTGAKRASTPSTAPAKKARVAGERITTKDFVPPDVSGMSKREARLVKNRAAAFLSRQRKREEFETMEIRVAELEQENARLRNQSTDGPRDIGSEVEQLRAQLAAAEARAGALSAQLSANQPGLIKMEPMDDDEDDEEDEPAESPAATAPVAVSRSRSSSVSSQKPDRSGASLGLMVLLCALPSLLSQYNGDSPSTSLPARFSVPLTAVSARSPFPSLPGPFGGIGLDIPDMMFEDVDGDMSMSFALPNPDPFAFGAEPPSPVTSDHHTLAFADSAALGLGDLDIAFDATPGDDGKIRVHILPQSTHTSRAASPTRGSSPFAFSDADPILGAPSLSDDDDMWGMPGSYDSSSMRFGSPVSSASGKRRVRIALKSMPVLGGEGGEWEVEVC